MLLYLCYFIVVAYISVCFGLIWLWCSSCLSCLSFLIMQTQILKDVSTSWQVRTNLSFFYFPFHIESWELSAIDLINMCMWMCLTAALWVCRTGDISWLIDKGSQWLHIWRSQGQTQSPPQHGPLWCWDTEQLSQSGHTLTHTLGTGLLDTHFTEDDTETCFCSWETL